MNKKFRSSCVIASCLDLIGDKWSLLIIRDMLLNKKISFKQIASSEEGIATNLLSSRLKLLESLEVITKRKLPENKIELAPLILEIVIWSDKYVREYNETMNVYDAKNVPKSVIVSSVQNEYRELVHQVLRQARNSSD
jgi:DNA-binding HxlR family transcriptional regulator